MDLAEKAERMLAAFNRAAAEVTRVEETLTRAKVGIKTSIPAKDCTLLSWERYKGKWRVLVICPDNTTGKLERKPWSEWPLEIRLRTYPQLEALRKRVEDNLDKLLEAAEKVFGVEPEEA